MEYRVLARKYRPTSFADLIGQEVLVRTLSNAIATGRLAHAFLLTGIRGIGKTTTARIIARALNCEQGPTVSPCGECGNCRMIAEDRHVDVLEMDAASRTGVNDIREIIDTVHYAPTVGRYKIYIIDEVHMLSTSAFNALLKTLEEPPPHVKFIFATTEARKIPVTILSRCQRFDLKRISQEMLATHLSNIAAKEGAALSPQAANLLAQAAEGSVRDGLSLLDQAIAQHTAPGEAVSEEVVRGMLGLADKSQTIALLERLLAGDATGALTQLRSLYEAGADPLLLLQDMLELTHFITRIKLAPAVAADVSYAENERALASALAARLSTSVLARLWQMLLKGVAEIRMAPSAIAAAEMVLVRAAHVSDLPTPAEAVRALQASPPPSRAAAPAAEPREPAFAGMAEKKTEFLAPPPVTAPRAAPAPEPAKPLPATFAEAVALLEGAREALMAGQLRQFASVAHYAPGELEFAMKTPLGRDFAAKVAASLERLTGAAWKVTLLDQASAPTLHEQAEQRRHQAIAAAAETPLVARVIEQFPGAEVVAVREAEPA